MFVLLVLMTLTVANSQVNDCMSRYLEPTGATCVGTPTACVNSKCTFSAARWTYLCCRSSTTVTQPVCPATMTPLLGSVITCRPSNPSTGCPAYYSCVQSSVAGTYMCCGGATTGVTTVPPTTT
uniref:Uncharacterized protein n=1 Tax=Plectus sambesii TaxID=2011161 RepID=A0A914V3Q8_9BILA